MQFSFEVEPESIATLATLAFEQIQESKQNTDFSELTSHRETCFKLKNEEKKRRGKTDKDCKISITEARSSEEFSSKNSYKESCTFRERLESIIERKENSVKQGEVMNFVSFFKKVIPQVREKAKAKREASDSWIMLPKPSRHSLSRNEKFYSKRNVIPQPREAQNIGKKQLKENQILAHLLIHFSIKKEQMGLVSGQSKALESVAELLNQEVNGLSDLEIYLDCFVGIFSNLLIYSKLQRFSKNPYKIPPSCRSNSAELIGREEFLSSIVKINPGEEHPSEQKIVKLYEQILKEPKIRKMPTIMWIEEGTLIKTQQIETLFFVYNLEQLIQALHSFKSKGYRQKDSLGELLKNSTDITNISTKLIDRSNEEKLFKSFEDSEIGKAFFSSETSRSLSLARLSTERSFTSPTKVERKSHFFKGQRAAEEKPNILEQEEELPEISQKSGASQEEIISLQESEKSEEKKSEESEESEEPEDRMIEKIVAEYEERSESEEEEEEDISRQSSMSVKKPMIAWKTGENWNK